MNIHIDLISIILPNILVLVLTLGTILTQCYQTSYAKHSLTGTIYHKYYQTSFVHHNVAQPNLTTTQFQHRFGNNTRMMPNKP